MPQALPYIALALAGVSAAQQVSAGKAQARGAFAQAQQTRLQAKQEALRQKEQGIKVLENILQTESMLVARGAAGGIDPFSGSAQDLAIWNQAKAGQDLIGIQEGQAIVMRGGELQAQQQITMGKAAFRGSLASAGATLVSGAIGYSTLGGPT